MPATGEASPEIESQQNSKVSSMEMKPPSSIRARKPPRTEGLGMTGALQPGRVRSERSQLRTGRPPFWAATLIAFVLCDHLLPLLSTEGLGAAFIDALSEGKVRAKSRLRNRDELGRRQAGTTVAGLR